MKRKVIEVDTKTGLLIGFFVLFVGLIFTAWKLNRILTEFDSLQWVQTNAVIESSNFRTTTRKSSNSTTTIHYGEFEYRYSVNGREFLGTQYDATGKMHTGRKSEMLGMKNRIKSNSVISIFYNPDDPSQSVIKNGISEDTSVRIVFSAFLLTAGSIILRQQWKNKKIPTKIGD